MQKEHKDLLQRTKYVYLVTKLELSQPSDSFWQHLIKTETITLDMKERIEASFLDVLIVCYLVPPPLLVCTERLSRYVCNKRYIYLDSFFIVHILINIRHDFN